MCLRNVSSRGNSSSFNVSSKCVFASSFTYPPWQKCVFEMCLRLRAEKCVHQCAHNANTYAKNRDMLVWQCWVKWFPKLQVQVRKHCQPYSNSNPIISSYLISYSMKSNQIMWALSWYLFEAFSKFCSHVYETGMKEGPNTFLLPLVDRTFSVAGFGGSWWECESCGAIPAIQKQRLSMALWPQVHFLFLETMLVFISSTVPWTSGL